MIGMVQILSDWHQGRMEDLFKEGGLSLTFLKLPQLFFQTDQTDFPNHYKDPISTKFLPWWQFFDKN